MTMIQDNGTIRKLRKREKISRKSGEIIEVKSSEQKQRLIVDASRSNRRIEHQHCQHARSKGNKKTRSRIQNHVFSTRFLELARLSKCIFKGYVLC